MNDLPFKARLFIFPLILTGVVLSIWNLADLRWWDPWLLAIAVLATVAQLFKVEGVTERSSYNIGWLIYGFTFVLLGAPAALFVILVAHLLEWGWRKYPWYIQVSSIAAYSLAISTAYLVYTSINPGMEPLTLMGTLGILAALLVFTLVNRLMIGSITWLTKSQNLIKSGVLNPISLVNDYTLISLGAAAAFIWMVSPTASIFSLIPLYLIYSTLTVPTLKRQTKIDPKTNLYDSRYFAKALDKELALAERFDRPLTLALGDLDLLRHINNTYGHLAGDMVLCGISDILQESFQGYDVVARFGGEEFAVLMPETTLEEAYLRVEAVREAIEESTFEVPTSVTPIKITISFGISGREGDNPSSSDLIHNADVALYDAKLSGRNLTRIYSNENVDYLFGLRLQKDIKREETPIERRSKVGQKPIKLDHSGKSSLKQVKSKHLSKSKRRLRPWWLTNAYIGIVALFALGLTSLLFKPVIPQDWMGLLLFAVIVIVTELLSIDVYLKDASISTSAAPFIAGVLLFGPVGAIFLSLVMVITSTIKTRSKLHRFTFNLSTQLIASSLCSLLILLINDPITTLSQHVQMAVAIVSGMIVYLSSTWLLSGVISLSVGSSLQRVWKEQFRWLWPYYLAFGVVSYALILGYSFGGVIGALAILVPLLTLRLGQVQYIKRTEDMVNQLRANNEELEKQGEKISILNEELLLSFANSIDLRDPYTLGHSRQVTHYAVIIAKELGLPPEQVDQIRKGGLLHDIGKLGIPDSILLKPGSLTNDEYEVIKQHPILGAQMLEGSHSLRNLIPMIRHHHERFDGKGYPDQIVGHAIPLEARILAVADAVEAMTSDRPYRRGLTLQEVIGELKECSGNQFDPRMVKLFVKLAQAKGENFVVNSAHKVDKGELQQVRVSLGLDYAWRNYAD